MGSSLEGGRAFLLRWTASTAPFSSALQGAAGNPIDKIILTCSGGPFRTWDKAAIRSATKAQALKHPNWVMGQKITIDSATLFNKALEIAEAKWLFGGRTTAFRWSFIPRASFTGVVADKADRLSWARRICACPFCTP